MNRNCIEKLQHFNRQRISDRVAENGGSAQNFPMNIKLLQFGHFTRADEK